MSRRTMNTGQGYSNPAVKFLEWKSNDKQFSFYDKEAKENVPVELPLKFQFLEEFHCVKGWHDASGSSITSNEVKLISVEPLEVKSFKGGPIANGLYKEIKPVIQAAGGSYHRSIYAILNGEIVNITLKGAAVAAYSEFMKENSNQTESAFMEITGASDHKKGSIKYSTPDFSVGKAFSKALLTAADEAYVVIADHFKVEKDVAPAPPAPDLDAPDEDLEF